MERSAAASTECDRCKRLEAALSFYAALGPDEIPYFDTINDPPDVGRTAREALRDDA